MTTKRTKRGKAKVNKPVKRAKAAPPNQAEKVMSDKQQAFVRDCAVFFLILFLLTAGTVLGTWETQQPEQANDAKQSIKNLQKLALAMHSYHDDLGTFPPAALLDKDKKPLLSWRVLLLQNLGERDLFKQFKLDEPWDSAHNKKLLSRMPKVYAPVGVKIKETDVTFYQVFTGPGTAFEGPRGLSVRDFTDGTSNTLLIVEAGEPVPWTKPADLFHDAKKPLPKLGGQFKDRIHFALADGSVMVGRRDFREKTMRAFIGRNDGEPINLEDILLQK